MKQLLRNWLGVALVLTMVSFCFSSCEETHYYHQNHHHTRGWYEHRHRQPPAGVTFDVDIHK